MSSIVKPQDSVNNYKFTYLESSSMFQDTPYKYSILFKFDKMDDYVYDIMNNDVPFSKLYSIVMDRSLRITKFTKISRIYKDRLIIIYNSDNLYWDANIDLKLSDKLKLTNDEKKIITYLKSK